MHVYFVLDILVHFPAFLHGLLEHGFVVAVALDTKLTTHNVIKSVKSILDTLSILQVFLCLNKKIER